MPQSRFTAANLKEAGPQKVEEALRKERHVLPKEMLYDKELRRFSFGDSRKRENLLVNMLLRVQPSLAIDLVDDVALGKELGPGGKPFVQFGVESSVDAALKSLKSREVYLILATSGSPYIKYIAHCAVYFKVAARFAFDCDDLCHLENKKGGSLEDYIKVLHPKLRLPPPERYGPPPRHTRQRRQ
jgi:hypothetical protein